MAPTTTTGPDVATVPAKREITIRDLLTQTAGLSYGTGPLEAQYKAANVYLWYFADKDEPIGATIDRLATLPFAAQPGERYVYGFATDVLGVVIEKASGLSLDEFFRTRIFGPLKMVDSSFYVPPSKASRFATVYAAGPGGLTRAPDPGRGQGDYVAGPRKSFSGGAGVVSTASDYARFLQMLLNGGELDGVRLLGPKSVELMTSNHVGTLYQDGRFGFGFGFEIVEHVGRSGRPGSVGEFGWGGAYYTKFWVDPVEKVVAVFMTQLLPSGGPALQDQFRVLVNQAIVQSEAKR
jgi:CubicO group peptidase (beta-lactamase class C family)